MPSFVVAIVLQKQAQVCGNVNHAKLKLKISLQNSKQGKMLFK
jgi:hypothetical protein